ncbi:MAG: glutathione S-transferase family protein [Rhodoferax sp.]|nr:glutathione S-transferase family protein [Rhodoferax sp.]
MKLCNGIGPNPRVVNMFLAEKGVDIDRVQIDLMAGENRRDAHLKRNPAGQLPTLELDDGTFIAEITAICEYLEELFPDPPLIGSTPQERAVSRMWTRRIDLHVVEPMLNSFRSSEGFALFKDRVRLLPQAADDLKILAQERIAWLDGLIGDGPFVAGARLTLADILLFCTMDFGASVGQPLKPDNNNIGAWFVRMKARPSAAASAW